MEQHRRPVRVALCNDSELVVHGVHAMLEPYADRIDVVAEATHVPGEGERLIGNADVVLIDAFRRPHGGLDAAAELLAGQPSFRVVLFTDARAEHLVRQALRIGVHGYILKTVAASGLADALERVARGEVVVSPELDHVVRRHASGAWAGATRGLSRREAEVLALLAEGRPPTEIAAKLNIALETVRSHLKRIYGKLGVNDRAAAVAIAWHDGLVDQPGVDVLN